MKLGKIILLGALAAGAAWFYKKYQDGKSASDAAPDGKDFPEPDFDGDIPAFDGDIPTFDGDMPAFDGDIPAFHGDMPIFDGKFPESEEKEDQQ